MIESIRQAWLVVAVALGAGVSLAGIQAALASTIAANKLDETLSVIPRLVPGSSSGEPAEVDGERVFRATDGTAAAGWVVPASGQGFADRIELLVGLSADGATITGVYVLDQKETPGLGSKITEAAWLEQFAGRPAADPIEVALPGGDGDAVDALTGATISSDAVAAIVHRAASAWAERSPEGPSPRQRSPEDPGDE